MEIEQLDSIGFRCRADGGEVTVLPTANVEGHRGAPVAIIGEGGGLGEAEVDAGVAPRWLAGVRGGGGKGSGVSMGRPGSEQACIGNQGLAPSSALRMDSRLAKFGSMVQQA